jgi:hypothetical protein
MSTFSPQELTSYTYAFIDFLFDESPLQAKPLSNQVRASYSAEQCNPDQLRDVGSLLSDFIWQYQILNWETVLLALADRDDDPNMYAILEYLLISDPQFSARVDQFLQTNVNKVENLQKILFIFCRIFGLKTISF